MSFIEVKPGFSINTKDIIWFKRNDEDGTNIKIDDVTIETSIPYFDFAMKVGRSEDKISGSKIEKDIETIMKTSQML